TPGRTHVAEQHVGQRGTQLLAVVGHVHDRTHVFGGPVDRVREAADQHDDGVRIDLVHAPEEVFGLERNPLAIDGFLAFVRRRRFSPAGVAGRVVADANDRDVGAARDLGVVQRIAYGDTIAGSVADALQ